MVEYILRDQAIIAVTGAKLPDVSASGLPIANGKRSVTDCVRRLKEIPAADVRPVVLGEWTRIDYEPHGHDYKCSACGWKNDMPTHFCPNCGAKMQNSLEKVEANSKKSLEKVEG